MTRNFQSPQLQRGKRRTQVSLLLSAAFISCFALFSQQIPQTSKSSPGSKTISDSNGTAIVNPSGTTNRLQQMLNTNASLNEIFIKLKAAEKEFVSELSDPKIASAAKKLRRTISVLRLDPEVQAKEAELRQIVQNRLMERIKDDPEQLKVFKLVKEHQDRLKSINTNALPPVFLFGN